MLETRSSSHITIDHQLRRPVLKLRNTAKFLQNGTVLTILVFQSVLAFASGIFQECTQLVESLQHHATQGKEVVLGILKPALKTKIIYKKRSGCILPAHQIVKKKKKLRSLFLHMYATQQISDCFYVTKSSDLQMNINLSTMLATF